MACTSWRSIRRCIAGMMLSAPCSLLSSKTGASGRPRMPPIMLISSQASSSPLLNERPSAAAQPVSGTQPPTGIGSPSARTPSLMSASRPLVMAAAPKPASPAPFMKFRRLAMKRLRAPSSLRVPRRLMIMVAFLPLCAPASGLGAGHLISRAGALSTIESLSPSRAVSGSLPGYAAVRNWGTRNVITVGAPVVTDWGGTYLSSKGGAEELTPPRGTKQAE